MFIINKSSDVVPFEGEHVKKSIASAARAVYGGELEGKIDVNLVAACAIGKVIALGLEKVDIEKVQDAVETALMENHQYTVAKAYILYRERRASERETKNDLISYTEVMNGYLDKSDWREKENSNVNYSIGGSILHNNSSITANYWLKRIYSPRIAEAHKNAELHLHDLGMFEPYCAGHSLRELILRGITGVTDKVSSGPAHHLGTLCQQMVNFLGILQNEWAGAQAFSSVDTYLAPFIKKDNLSYKEVYQCCQTLLYGINTPSRWGCVPPDTEILTKDGWKHYTDIKVGDGVYGFDLASRAIVDDYIDAVNVYDYDGDMVALSGRGTDQLLSPNHKVVRQVFNSTELIKETAEDTFSLTSAHVNVPVSGSWDGEDSKSLDSWLKLAAWILAEGSIQTYQTTSKGPYAGGSRITVSQSSKKNPLYCNEIEQCLTDLGFGFSISENTSGLGDGVTVYRINAEGTKRLVKDLEKGKLPMHVLRECSRRQIRLFLDTYRKADGVKSRFRIITTDQEVYDNLLELGFLAGYAVSTMLKSPKGISKKLQYTVSFNMKSPDQVVSVTKKTKVYYKGTIWCPTTETNNWVARRNGQVFITGNSQAPFSNFTHDWTVPADMKDRKAIVDGVEQDFTYGDCQAEMNLFNKAFFTLFTEGDSQGRSFQYPIPTINITKDFWDQCPENQEILFKLTSKFGTPYFQNFINSDMDPQDVRSMCPLAEGTMVKVRSNRKVRDMPIRLVVEEMQEGAKFEVYHAGRWHHAKPVIAEKQQAYAIRMTNGTCVTMGEFHWQPVVKADGTYTNAQAKDLKVGDMLPYSENRSFAITEVKKDDTYAGELYCFEVDSSTHLFTLTNGLITHNCRLRLDKRELRKRGGGLFGSAELTGSVGVVTLNLPRIGYLANDETDFYARLDDLMDVARDSLEIKRKVLTKNLAGGLYPYTKAYISSFDNFFSTIGLVGMNEACRNLFGSDVDIGTERGLAFAVDVLNHMRDRIATYQVETGNLYNLESTPAESTCYRLALHDKKKYPDIITAGSGEPYYTNSSNLPVGYTDDPWEAIEHQEGLQTLYTGGCVTLDTVVDLED